LRCSSCGTPLDRHITDVGFRLPDVVWAIPGAERDRRVRGTGDHLSLDTERHFIRGVAYIPLIGERRARFGWGLWAEVDAHAYRRYLQLLRVDASDEPPVGSVLANTPVGYEPLGAQAAMLHLSTAAQRPALQLLPSEHLLYREQRDGMDGERLHFVVGLQSG